VLGKHQGIKSTICPLDSFTYIHIMKISHITWLPEKQKTAEKDEYNSRMLPSYLGYDASHSLGALGCACTL
jgi:hypothetical protein